MISDLFDFLRVKIAASGKTETGCVYRIRFGDLLKDSGDILLCPVSADFKPSNRFAQSVLRSESKWLSQKLDGIRNPISPEEYIGTEHVAFLPCRKLKYRGILFVSVDFYAENREEINAERIAEAFTVAAKYGCRKLSCPVNFLYSPDIQHLEFDGFIQQLEKVLAAMPEEKIPFIVEYVLKKDIKSFRIFSGSQVYYDFSNASVEYLPRCAQILPGYRKQLHKIRIVYPLSRRTARIARKCLSPDMLNKRQMFRAFKKLWRKMGEYWESGVDRCNDGFAFFLLGLCNEMPWMFNELDGLIREFNTEVLYNGLYYDFIFKERFRDAKKFETRLFAGGTK